MEIYDCGRLKLILGRTGNGKSYAVKQWLRRTEKKVLIVGFPEEYKSCDVIDCRKPANIIDNPLAESRHSKGLKLFLFIKSHRYA